MTAATSVKNEVKLLADKLPEDATWEDVAYAIYVRESIDQGLRDLDEGRVSSTEEVRQRLGLSQ